MDKNEFKVYRTLEGTIFEVVTALLIISSVLIMALSSSREMQAEGIVEILILAACAALFLALAYHPTSDFINIPVKRDNLIQLSITVRMMRVIAVDLAVISLLRSLMMADFIKRNFMPDNVIGIIILAVLCITIGYYSWKIKQAKNSL